MSSLNKPWAVTQWVYRRFSLLHARLRVRAVATPVRDLLRLLREPTASLKAISHLQLVASTLRARDGFHSVPPAILKAASQQLVVLLTTTRSAGLEVLDLQMRRQVVSNTVRGELAQSGAPMNCRPTAKPLHRTPGFIEWHEVGGSDFEVTVPVDRCDGASNESVFAPMPKKRRSSVE